MKLDARGLSVLIGFALLAAVPWLVGEFYADLAVKVMALAIFALSLELLVGQTGLVCFGHAAFFGIAAYVAALLSPQSGGAAIWWLLPAALAASGVYALAVGALSLRTRGIYFIMVTLAFAQMAYYVFHDTPFGGGTDGVYLYFKPEVKLGSLTLVDLEQRKSFYYFVLGALAFCFGALALLLRSRFGRVLAGIKANEQRLRAAGFATYPYKLAAFVVAAMFAGLAGFVVALKDGYVNPEILSWHQSGAVLLMIILGGLGHLRGAVLGAVAFTLLQELYQSQAVFGAFAKHWQLLLGLTIIAFVAALPDGLMGLGRLLRRRPRSQA
ncbi:MAG TPA: branched-chain amino acid ABC transporter permease [Methylibium sp.]|uniref:branched-chain amino acid ABC transporter permease n=1 Tax=Methylibium sp. TaxID=2067992 RepID=UPI002DB72897|nr:branched-chain amino acid ABC transporter permease [Methylibium sp.]HEU4457508.1 branched-chain amino acid ABC transporter permease [Methylibium sp.]